MNRFVRSLLAVTLVGLVAPPLLAAPPTVNSLFPAGGQRGTTVRVRITGKLDKKTKAWCSRPDVKLQLITKSRTLKLTIPEKTHPGVFWLRMYNAEGPSPPRAFVIGTLPEVNEQEPNDRLQQSQPLKSSAVVVNGVLAKSGEVDSFAVSLKKGRTLVASLTANNTLASPMDGILQVVSSRGFVLEQNDDDIGFDPQIDFTAPKDDTYHVRLFAFPAKPNSSVRLSGAATYIYRLTLTTQPFLDHPFPLAVTQRSARTIQFHGWNIAREMRSRTAPASGSQSTVPVFHGKLAGTSHIRVVPHAAETETEPNSPTQPQSVQLPTTVSGHIGQSRDTDNYRFAAKKGDRLRFRVEARSIGSPLDPMLRLFDAKGKNIAQAETRSSKVIDESLSYRVPADGRYRLQVGDLHRRGGWRYFYRLTLGPNPLVGRVSVAADQFTLSPGKPLSIPVTVEGSGISTGRYKLVVRGLPKNISAAIGKVTKSKSKRRRSRSSGGRKVTVTLTSKSATGFQGSFRIVAVPVGKAGLEFPAEATVAGTGESISRLWLTVPQTKSRKPKSKSKK